MTSPSGKPPEAVPLLEVPVFQKILTTLLNLILTSFLVHWQLVLLHFVVLLLFLESKNQQQSILSLVLRIFYLLPLLSSMVHSFLILQIGIILLHLELVGMELEE